MGVKWAHPREKDLLGSSRAVQVGAHPTGLPTGESTYGCVV